MQKQFAAFKRITLTGLLFLVPLYVVLLIAKQAWTSLHSMGSTLAKIFGVSGVIGVGAPTALSVVLLILLCYCCGLVAHVSIVAAVRSRLDGWLAAYIPGYAKHRGMVEQKLDGKMPALPYASALIRQQEFWRPAYLVEQDPEGNCVLFLPDVPDTANGTVLLAKRPDIVLVPSLSANDLDGSLKKRGAGLSGIASRERSGP
jgi:hypothetical protein